MCFQDAIRSQFLFFSCYAMIKRAEHSTHQIIRLCVESSMLRVVVIWREMCQMKSEKMRFDNENLCAGTTAPHKLSVDEDSRELLIKISQNLSRVGVNCFCFFEKLSKFILSLWLIKCDLKISLLSCRIARYDITCDQIFDIK